MKNFCIGIMKHDNGGKLKQRLIIDNEIMTFNQYDNKTRGNKFAAATVKKTESERVAWLAKASKLKPLKNKTDFRFTFYCKNKMKDKDNIMFQQKFIFDGLQLAGILKNDGWNEIGKLSYDFAVDKENPRIEIEMSEIRTEIN